MVGIQRGDVQPSGQPIGQATHVEATFPASGRFPVICRSGLNSMTTANGPATSTLTSVEARAKSEAERTLVTIRTDSNIEWGKKKRSSDERASSAEHEVYLEALGLDAQCRPSAIRTKPSVKPGPSVLVVPATGTRPHSLGSGARHHANIRRRRRHGMPVAVSFRPVPVVYSFQVQAGNRLHGLPMGAIRSTKHTQLRVGAL